MKTQACDFLIDTNLLTMISIRLFYYCKKVFIHMNTWMIGKFNKTSLPGKEDFYSHLNMEDITDSDYAHANRICKDFEIKFLGEYCMLYVQGNI